jgi:hypothetical protein
MNPSFGMIFKVGTASGFSVSRLIGMHLAANIPFHHLHETCARCYGRTTARKRELVRRPENRSRAN